MGGWTFDDYMNQPSWYIELIKIKRDCEIKHQNSVK